MTYALEDIGASLKAARTRRGLSQRALADAAGTDQARVSKIEAGDINLRLSSLIDLARTLGLELILAERHHLPAIKAMMSERARGVNPKHKARLVRQIADNLQRLVSDLPEDRQLKRASDALTILDMAGLTEPELSLLADVDAVLNGAQPDKMSVLRPRLDAIIRLRNAKAQGTSDTQIEQLPAYTLDDDDE